MSKGRKTRNPIIWLQYTCWRVSFWMMFHKPYYPLWVRIWALKHYGQERYSLTWDQIRRWQEIQPNWKPTALPLPWYVGPNAFGPFVGPWNRLQSLVRRGTGGRSHRCEFTDPERGALYGHRDGAFMDEYFEELVERISDDEADEVTA